MKAVKQFFFKYMSIFWWDWKTHYFKTFQAILDKITTVVEEEETFCNIFFLVPSDEEQHLLFAASSKPESNKNLEANM